MSNKELNWTIPTLYLPASESVGGLSTEARLMRSLLDSSVYDKRARPVTNVTDRVRIFISVHISRIQSLVSWHHPMYFTRNGMVEKSSNNDKLLFWY